MKCPYDSRYITNEFLLNYFPSPDKFAEMLTDPPISTLEVSKQRYINFKNSLNQKSLRIKL